MEAEADTTLEFLKRKMAEYQVLKTEIKHLEHGAKLIIRASIKSAGLLAKIVLAEGV